MAAAFIPAQLVCADATDPSLFPAGRFNLTVTSPPYNVGLQYGANVDDAGSYDDYLEFSRRWLANCFNWSADHGRLCMNIPLDKNSGGKQVVTADLTNISRRTAWGSWMRPLFYDSASRKFRRRLSTRWVSLFNRHSHTV